MNLAPQSSMMPPGGFLLDPLAMRPAKLKKLIPLIANQHEEAVAEIERKMGRNQFRRLFVTLTYAKNTRGDPRDVSKLLDCVRKWLVRLGLPMVEYLWVAEVQRRGALHYHLMIWLPKHLRLPKLDRRGWWRHGMTQVQTARNPVGYLAKYASKCGPDDLKKLRKGTRLYGYGGVPAHRREALRRLRMARWARAAVFDREDRGLVDQLTLEAALIEQDAAWLFGTKVPRWARERLRLDEREQDQLALAGGYTVEDVRQLSMTGAEYEAERLWMAECANKRARLLRAGCALYPKVSGGIVYRPTGEVIESPWQARFEKGVLVVWPKEVVQ
jgi:hypothetical protein